MLPTTEFALLRRLAAEQASGRAPSIVAAVVRGGRILWSGARGAVEGELPDDDTQYRLGSITKSLIAVLVMRLRDEGRLELTDPLERHLPGTAFDTATVGQLLSHTAGVTAESPGSWWERSPGADWAALADSLGDGAKLPPGKQFHYSNVGYGVLGELVGRLRGRPWAEVLAEEVLTPLGMDRTSPMPEGRHATGWAVHPFADVLLPEPSPHAGAMAPAGQLWSTVADLARWTSFVGGRTGNVLHPDTVAEMRAVATVDSSSADWSVGYGLGLQLIRVNGRLLAGHTGSMPGFLACSLVDPAGGTGALTMTNATAGVGIVGLVAGLINLVEDYEPELPTTWAPTTVDPALLALTGLWHWGPAPFHLYALAGGWLNLRPAGDAGRASRFRPSGPDEWIGLDGYYTGETLRVHRDAEGVATHLNLVTFVFTRTPYDPAAPVPGGVDEAGWR